MANGFNSQEAGAIWGHRADGGLSPMQRKQLRLMKPMSPGEMALDRSRSALRKMKVEISKEERDFIMQYRLYHWINCYRIVKQFCRWCGFYNGDAGKGLTLRELCDSEEFKEGFHFPVNPMASKLKRSNFVGVLPRKFLHNFVQAKSLEKDYMGVFFVGEGYVPRHGMPFLHPPLPVWAWNRGNVDPKYLPTENKDPLLHHWLQCVETAMEHLEIGHVVPELMPELGYEGAALLDDEVLARAIWPRTIDPLVDIEEGILSEVSEMQDAAVSDQAIGKHLSDKYGFGREEVVHTFQMATKRFMDEEELCDPDRAFIFNVRQLKKALNTAIESGDMRGRTAILKQISVLTGANKTGADSGDASFEDIMMDVMEIQDADSEDSDSVGGIELTSGAHLDLPMSKD